MLPTIDSEFIDDSATNVREQLDNNSVNWAGPKNKLF